MTDALKETVQALPRSPGVYLMKDRRGKILYVGKARSLRSRVASYFAASRVPHPRTDALVERIVDLDFIVTDTDLEALILEQSLIKQNRPRYNVRIKDDKKYPYLKLTTGHRFPGVEVTRDVRDRSARFFGPYADVASLRHTVKRLRRAFPLRVCSDTRVMQSSRRECLDYFIGSCSAPCTRRVSDDEYGEIVAAFSRFIAGQGDDVLKELEAEMNTAAEKHQYERAAVFRDRLRAVGSVLRKQKIETPGGDDVDVVGIASQKDEALGLVLRIRKGKLIGKEQRTLVRTEGLPQKEVLEHFLTRFYGAQDVLPGRLAVPVAPPEPELVEAWLSKRTGRKVHLVVPQRGKLAGLLRVAMRNAALILEESRARAEGERRLGPELYELQQALGLESPPVRIEGVDVSTIQGTDKVASVVCFIAGRPEKALYRRYRIKTVEGADDFASIQEVIDRRVSRALDEGQDLPDLFLIDGGKGQLGAARRALAKYDLESLPAVGLAKREELVVFHDRPALRLSRRSEALKLLQRIRNEAHRFAVSYHRTLRSKRLTRSALDDVPGIGPRRKALLITTFGSVEAMGKASEEALAEVPGIGRTTARAILDALSRKPDVDAPTDPLEDGDAEDLDGLGTEEALALDDEPTGPDVDGSAGPTREAG